jgi:diaminopimelate epimerase
MHLYNSAVDTLPFVKLHGCGNDFIVFDDAAVRFSWEQLSQLAVRFCDRRFGIGGDGLIAIGPAGPSAAAGAWDYEMRYVNADGSRAEMCGNGIRCLGKYVADELHDKRDAIHVLTGAGVLPVSLLREADGTVHSASVGMGVPRLLAREIPTTLAPAGEQVLGAMLPLKGAELPVTAVNMGNPHAVSFHDKVTDYHVLTLGPQVETHPAFPRKVNAEFVQALSPTRLRMRVWERGCGETWACGTGACASVVAAVMTGRCSFGAEVTVVLNGGELRITWPARDAQVLLTGPAVTVFRGVLDH